MSFENTKVLVVGGAGFVGSNLVNLLLNENKVVKIEVVDNLMSAEKENLPLQDPRLRFVHTSITDDRYLDQLEDDFDYIFHLATFHGNQSSIHDPIKDHDNNTLTTLKLMNQVKNYKFLKKLVYSSAGCSAAKKTYDDAEATTEEAPISLVQDSPYSISKVIGEFYAVYFNKQHSLPTVRARFQNVYGPGEVLGAGEWRGTPATVWRNVTPTFIWKCLHGDPIQLHNGGDASRDFIFVEDICRGLMACALKGKSGDVYNLASGQEVTIKDWANMIAGMTGHKSKVELLPKRDWDTSGKRFGATDKSKNELGFNTSMPLQDGLKKTIDWTIQNQKFIQSKINKHQKELT